MSSRNSPNLSTNETEDQIQPVFEEEHPFGMKEKINLAVMESSTASIEVISNKLPIYYTDFIGMSPTLVG